MPPEPDYPAAHSMDADWFAVDKDGHVAIFSTGEAGAIPQNAATIDGNDILDRLVQAAPPAHSFFDIASWIGDGEDRGEPHVDLDEHYVFWALMFVDSIEPVRDLVDGGQVLAIPGPVGVVVFNRGLNDGDRLRRLHEAGHCLGCFELDGGELAARLGLFGFGHSNAAENWIAGPYERNQVPPEPLRADALPEPLRSLVEGVRFDALSFPATDRLQPVEHIPCSTWGGCEYLAVDGVTIRALPGQEDEYRAEHGEKWTDPAQREAERPYRYEPPAG